jgi:hypothetical protein
VIPKFLAISEAGIPSIYISITMDFPLDQVNSLKRYNSITYMTNVYQNDTTIWSI